jgi:Tfp pilus assembly protein PilF
MPAPEESDSGLCTELWQQREAIVQRFEQAWHEGRPAPEDYLPAAGPLRRAVLGELIHADLECRLRAGEPARVEDYLGRFPELADDAACLLDLVVAEYHLRRPRERGMTAEDYVRRFPQLDRELRYRLQDPAAAKRDLSGTLPGPAGSEAGAPGAAALPRVPGYEILGELGRGGMGLVLRARDPDFGRSLAVKVLLPEAREQPGAAERFLEEARLTGRLQHPGIPPVHELGVLPDGSPFFAMKLIEGRTLAALLKETEADGGAVARPRPDLPRLLGAFRQVCQAVAYVHSCGVLHRDLKPSNVMVGAFGEVQVMDWGLAKRLPRSAEEGVPAPQTSFECPGPAEALSATGDVLGTPAYMAPEQARGAIHTLDPRSDVFGLGAILCEILTGTPPFGRGGGLELLLQAQAGNLAGAFERLGRCGADAELVELARMCLAPRKEDRPADAGGVAEAVERYEALVEERLRRAELEGAEARVQAEEERKRRHVEQARADAERRRRRATLGLAAAVLLLVAGAAAAAVWYEQDQAARAVDEAQRESERRRQLAVREQSVGEALDQGRRDCAALQDRLARPGGVFRLLDRPADWRRFLDAARAALRRAADLKGGAEAPLAAGLQQQMRELEDLVRQDEIDERRAARLEKTRVDRAMVVANKFGWGAAGQEYGAAFKELRLAFLPGREDQDATLLRRSAIKEQLLAALDDWALVAWVRAEKDLQRRLLAVARRADPGPWKDRVRDPGRWDNPRALKELTTQALSGKDGLSRTSPQLLGLLAFLLQAREPAAAEGWLRRAQAAYPADFWLNFDMGIVLADKPAHAEGCFRAALVARPDSAAAWYNLGHVLYGQKDLAGAADAFRKALDLSPSYTRAWNNLGVVLRDQKDLREAARALRKAASSDPKDPAPWNNLGLVLRDQHRLREAADAHRKALDLDPNHAGAWYNLGTVRRELKDLRGAAKAFRRAVAIAPKYAIAWNDLGAALFDLKEDLPGAAAALRKGLDLDPGNALAWYNLGNVLYSQQDPLSAAGAFRKALDLNPRYAKAWNSLGAALAARQDWRGAAEAFRKAADLSPDEALALRNLGTALQNLKDLRGAAEALRRAVKLDPAHAVAWYRLGEVQVEQGAFARAAACFQRALELRPANPGLVAAIQRGLKSCAHALALEKRLPAVLQGGQASAAEQLELAHLCQRYRRCYRDAARLYAAAFAGQPRLAEDVNSRHRYHAALAAALAAAGVGKGAERLGDGERAALHKQAVSWLRADLALWRTRRANGGPGDPRGAQPERLIADYRNAREGDGPAAAEMLSNEGAEECRRLWADVAALLE